MRLIDADALTKMLIPLWNCHDDSEFANKDIWQAIENAPPIEPEPPWIPCSKRLPDKPDGDYEYEFDASLIQAEEYIVMIKDAEIPTTLFWTGDKWFEPYDGDPIYYSVVAWMPLPKPYRKDGE